jgi:small-conductance mechanosensitive channel
MLFRYPASLALLETLILALLIASNLPILVRNLLILLFVIPVLRFLPSLVSPVFRPLLYLLVAFGLAFGFWEMIGGALAMSREVAAGVSLVAVGLGAWLIRPSRVRRLQSHGETSSLAVLAIYAILALVFASLAANIFGYTVLSRVLRTGVALSAFFAVILYTAFLALTSVFSLFWRSRQASMLFSVRTHQESAAKRGSRLLGLAAFVLWLYGTLNFFTVRGQALAALSSTLTTRITVGAASFTLGDVLTFVAVLALGALFAHVVRVVLWADVLARLPLKHGLPYAISTITYYVLVLVGFFFALAAAGVELSRFTLLTGAFGVGIGFGLQNVINNFVSGIILLFERPIRIGDYLEVGDATGRVERIGPRSTSIRTPQGAEVILPNSTLISNQVINWTLTEQRRRGELSVEVAYDTDPERVLKLLVEVAASHPDVLGDPKPAAVFQGFGNGALGFELRFWVPQARMHHQVKSDIGVKVAVALREAGINLALPRRELYLKSLEGPEHRDVLSLAAAAPYGVAATDQQIQKEEGAHEK